MFKSKKKARIEALENKAYALQRSFDVAVRELGRYKKKVWDMEKAQAEKDKIIKEHEAGLAEISKQVDAIIAAWALACGHADDSGNCTVMIPVEDLMIRDREVIAERVDDMYKVTVKKKGEA